ncbi:MAG: LVIVD repeat-containing protein [Verrucomicrobiales bacterium]
MESTTAVAVIIDPGRLFVLNVANPALPALTGTLNIPAADRAHVRIYGDAAWIVAGRNNALSLQAFDISNPAAPVPRGSVPLQTSSSVLGNDFEIVGSRAYVTGSHVGLIVCDISNPDAPFVLSTTPLPPFIVDVTVLGNYAYAASTAAGLQVVDISDPAQPRWVTGNSAYHTRSVANADGFVFAGGYSNAGQGSGASGQWVEQVIAGGSQYFFRIDAADVPVVSLFEGFEFGEWILDHRQAGVVVVIQHGGREQASGVSGDRIGRGLGPL